MDKWLGDLRYAIRSLTIRRGSSLATTLVIALGVGLLTTMFALADPYTLRPLPFAQPEELVLISAGTEGVTPDATLPTMNDWRADNALFQAMGINQRGGSSSIQISNGAISFLVEKVTADFFRVLALPEPSAAWFVNADETTLPIVLTPSGRRRLPTEMTRPGSVLRLETGAYVVAGHLPDSFVFPNPRFGRRVDGIVPSPDRDVPVLDSNWGGTGRLFGASSPTFIARLQPNVTPQMAQDRLSVPLPSERRLNVRVESLSAVMTAEARPFAWGALAAGLLILLVCAGNVANLSLVRNAFRSREFATRTALGATRTDIARLWLLEHAILASVAVAIGFGIAALALLLVDRAVPDAFLILGAPRITLRVAVFAALTGIIVGLIAFAPTVAMWARTPRALGVGTTTATAGFTAPRFIFMAAQSGLAIILAIGSAMLLQSYHRLVAQDTGYNPDTAVVSVTYPVTPRGVVDVGAQIEATLEGLKRVPGVLAAGATNTVVVGEGLSIRRLSVAGESVSAAVSGVTPGFFTAAGMSILRGRGLSADDRQWQGVVVNEAFVRAFLSGVESPIGQSVTDQTQAQVVGIIRDAFDKQLDVAPTPTVYYLMETLRRNITYVVATTGTSDDAGIRRAIADVNSRATIGEVDTIGGRFAQTVRDRTFATLVLTIFGIAGIAVSIAGLVGIVAFVVTRRTREIAVRVSLGARPADIRRLVLREAVTAAAAGGCVGLFAGRWLSLSLEHLVYGITAGNWVTTTVAAGAMVAVMVIAALVPAQRAVDLSPSLALRVD